MTTQHPTELIRFITDLPVSENGRLLLNNLETGNSFDSELYTPSYFISVLARITQGVLKSDKIELVQDSIREDTITYKILNSDLYSSNPAIYLLVRAIVLECFSLVYHINEDRPSLRYVSQKDILRIKENISYVNDYFGSQYKYLEMIEVMRHMYISLGYIEHQIDVIMSGGAERR